MNIVLLSGGSGKRLWPLSNDIRSKQFLKIFKKTNDEYESMVQRVYRQIKEVNQNSNITIATSKSQLSSIFNQLGDNVSVSVEPCRRDTFPAIALAVSYLKYVQGLSDDEVVIICPVDPYVENEYFSSLSTLADVINTTDANLALLGIEPTYPSDKYGYIIPKTKDQITEVSMFKEKPNTKIAAEYLQQGALWNGGVFALKVGYLLNIAHQLIDFDDYDDLFNKYETLEKISFDYAVVEKESKINVLRFNGEWNDLGTWNTLSEQMQSNIIGQGIQDEHCDNVHIVNELDVPIITMGLKDVIVSASPDGILVSDKDKSGNIKKYVEEVDQIIMFADKSWGNFKVVDVESKSLTIRLNIKAGKTMTYHSHDKRSEILIVTSGQGKTNIDGLERNIKIGDIVTIEAGCKHSVEAITDLQLLEIQLGDELSVSDKVKYEKE